jgi:hypothetical protein
VLQVLLPRLASCGRGYRNDQASKHPLAYSPTSMRARSGKKGIRDNGDEHCWFDQKQRRHAQKSRVRRLPARCGLRSPLSSNALRPAGIPWLGRHLSVCQAGWPKRPVWSIGGLSEDNQLSAPCGVAFNGSFSGISFASSRSLPPVFARRSRIQPDIERHDYPQNPLVEPSWTTTTTSSLALRGSYLGLSRFFFAAAVIYSRLPLFGLNTTKALRSRFLILHEFVAIDGRSCIVPSAFQDTRISLRHLATRN